MIVPFVVRRLALPRCDQRRARQVTTPDLIERAEPSLQREKLSRARKYVTFVARMRRVPSQKGGAALELRQYRVENWMIGEEREVRGGEATDKS